MSLLLATAAGAGKGLEDVVAEERQQELMRMKQAELDRENRLAGASIQNTQSEIGTRNSTTARANTTADLANQETTRRLDVLNRVTGMIGDPGRPSTPGTSVDLSLPGQPAPAPRQTSGFSRLNTPEGRATLEMAKIPPDGIFGAVPQPPKPKGPEDFSAEESYYNGIAKKAGYSDYKQWAMDHPNELGVARRKWADEGHFINPVLIQMPGANGDPEQKFVTPTAGAVYGAKPTATSISKAEDRKRASKGLDQLDQAINDAATFIGPGPGRISNFEQIIGNPDPKIAALGTKMLMAKMQVDSGIGGMRAAASPQLLDRWDKLFSQNMTPAALHASVQAMKEMLMVPVSGDNSGPAAPAAASDPYTEYLKRHGGGQ